MKNRPKWPFPPRRRGPSPAPNPEFVYDTGTAPAEFVSAVRAAVGQLDFDDRTQFPEWEAAVYRLGRAEGAARAIGRLRVQVAGDPRGVRIMAHFATNLGEQVLRRVPRETLLRHIPYHDVFFRPHGRRVLARFRSLRQASGPGGTAYYSRRRPTVTVGGRPLTVAFSRHAIERTCERTCATWPSYAALGDAFALLGQCQAFEPCELGGQPAFTFWENCQPGFWNSEVAARVLGGSFVPGERYSYRVGYCPAVVEGGFLKAKTLLFPGHAQTPEHRLMTSSPLPAAERRRMAELCKTLSAARTAEGEITDLLRWFHEGGVPQVRAGGVRYASVWD
jgi:hypothetical protein